MKKLRISVVIPSLDGYRNDNVPRLLEDIEKQTVKPDEIQIVEGVSPCSRAHNVGVRLAKGEIIIFFDDDVRLGDEHVLENLLKPFKEDTQIGITGASQRIQNDSNWFQRRYARQVPRSQSDIVDKVTDSDMVTHAAMAISKTLFRKVGGENENLIRGDDPELRFRVREAGYRIVVVPHTWIYHPPPASFGEMVRAKIAHGRGAAHDYCYDPSLVIEVPEGHTGNFRPRRSRRYRLFRAFFAMLKVFLAGKWILLVSLVCYYWGYVSGMIVFRKRNHSHLQKENKF